MEQENLIDARVVAKRLGVSYRQVLKMAEQGQLPHIRIGDLYRFDPKDIEKYIEESKQPKKEEDK